jgi:hypothetical protein
VTEFINFSILNTAFSADGYVVHDIGFEKGNSYQAAIAVQAEGKIIVAGTMGNATTSDFGTARFGGPPPITFTEHQIAVNSYYAIDIVDIDRDGGNDVISAIDSGNTLVWFKFNSGTWTQQTIKTGLNGLRDVYVTDFDNDLDMDVAVANTGGSSVYLYKNNGSPGNGTSWTESLLSTTPQTPMNIIAGDLDSDGDLDIFYSGLYSDAIYWLENNGSPGNATSWTERTVASFFGAYDVHLQDMDGDGDKDVIGSALFNTPPHIAWWENDGTPTTGTWIQHVIANGSTSTPSIAVSDLDNDGDYDVVAAEIDPPGSYYWVENNGSPGYGQNWTSHTIQSNADYARFVAIADLNRDGYADIVSSQVSTSAKLSWFMNSNAFQSGSWGAFALSTSAPAPSQMRTIDLDKDGDLDILGVPENGALRWWEQDGTPPVTCTPVPASYEYFIENFNTTTSDYFCPKNSVTMNVTAPGSVDSKSAQFVLPAGVVPGPVNGAELASNLYQYGTFSARFMTGKCSKENPNDPVIKTGVVTGFFTFFNGGDENNNGIIDNSEIDFEWLCAEPQVVYLSMYTDYEANPDGTTKFRRQLLRVIDLSTGEIKDTVYRLDGLVIHLNGDPQQDKPPTSAPISGLPQGYNSSTAFYEYGFTWTANRVIWWIVNPSTGQKIKLWDYQNPAGATFSRIPARPARFMFNLWHTSDWTPASNGDAKNSPTIPVYSYLDWAAYSAGPEVISITRSNTNPTSASTVDFKVTFSEPVTGVDFTAPFNDFTLTTSGVLGASIIGVSGSSSVYTVKVDTGNGTGTIRLDVVDNNSIVDEMSNPLGGLSMGDGDFISGETYTVENSLPSPWIGGVSITSDKNVVAVGRPHIGSEITAYDGFSAGAHTAYVPMLFKNAFANGGYDSAFYIQNVDSALATYSIEYYDSTGDLTCTVSGETVAPLASKGYWLPAISAACLPDGWVGGAVVTSDKDIVANGRPHINGEVMTYDSFSAGSLTSYLPMLFKNAFANGGYDSAFYVQNVDPTNTAALDIKYYDSMGSLTCTVTTETVAPLASKGYWLPALSAACIPDGWVGGVVITSTAPIVTVGRPHIGTQITTYNGFSAGSTSSFVPMLFKNAFANGAYDAAFYVQNLNPSTTANLDIKYYDLAGTLTCTVTTETIAPLASKGYWLPTLAAACLPDGWVGGAVVISNVDIVAIGRPHIGAQVMTYNGFTAGSLSSYLPMLFKDAFANGSYDSAFYIQNTEATAATVVTKFYDNTGALTCSRSDTLPTFSTLSLWAPNLTCVP